MFACCLKCLIVVTVLGNVRTQFPMLGGCPEFDTVKDFNLTAYLGNWHEIEKYFSLFQVGSRCVHETYGLRDNSSIGINHNEIGAITSRQYDYDGFGAFLNDNNTGKFIVKYPGNINLFGTPYYILDTDYNNYSVVWSCNNYGIVHRSYIWIYSRTKNPNAVTMRKAYKVVSKNNLSTLFLRRTNQSNC